LNIATRDISQRQRHLFRFRNVAVRDAGNVIPDDETSTGRTHRDACRPVRSEASDNPTTTMGDHALIPLIIHGDRCAATRIDIPRTCARPQLELGYVIGNQEVKLTDIEIFAADVPAGAY